MTEIQFGNLLTRLPFTCLFTLPRRLRGNTAERLDKAERLNRYERLSCVRLIRGRTNDITMRLVAIDRFIGSNWYRRPRKRPLVGPTGSPFLDILVMQTRACRWFRKNKSVNPLKRVTFRKYDRVAPKPSP